MIISPIKKYQRKLFYAFSPVWRRRLRKIYYFPQDLLFPNSKNIPSRGETFTGAGDYIKDGESFSKYLLDHCQLTPSSKVLDIGSGIGRLAFALTKILEAEGVYHGFDIVNEGIAWCINNISDKNENFFFKLINISNDLYNNGSIEAIDFVFPYKENYFNVASSISVFTHLQPKEVENYLQESSRVLLSGGYMLASFFIMTDARKKMKNSSFEFIHHLDNAWYMSDKVLSANVAYEERYIQDLALRTGFEIVNVNYGSWHAAPVPTQKGVTQFFQDFLVFRKK